MPLLTAFLLLVAALCMWVVDYVHMPDLWLNTLIAQLLVLLNALQLSMTLYRAKATAHFSLLPAVLYVLAVAVFPYLRMHWQPQLIVCLLLFYLLFTRDMSDTHEPNGLVFIVTLLLCLTAMLVPDALWCIPLLWLVVLLQGAFTFRTIVASILAVVLVGGYYVIAMYFGWVQMWDFSVLYNRHWIGGGQPVCLTVTLITLFVAFLCLTAGAFRRSSYDLVSTRMLLYHAVLWGLLSTPLVLFISAQPDYEVLLPLSLSAVAGIFFMQKQSEARGITLLLYLVGTVAFYLWMVISL